jgi:hypothetical protein
MMLLLSSWLWLAQAGAWPCPQTGDTDGDGRAERLVLEPGRLEVVSEAGWSRALPYPAAAVRRACLGDLDGDGRAEVVLSVVRATERDPTFRPRLVVLGVFKGNAEPVFLGTQGAGALVEIGLGDRDGDGRPELWTLERVAAGAEVRAWRWQGFGWKEEASLSEGLTPPPGPAPPDPPAWDEPPPTPSEPEAVALGRERVKGRMRAVSLRADLSGLANPREARRVPQAARAHLVRHGFAVVRPAEAPDEHHLVYLENQYLGIPTFVTADSALHLVHLLFDSALAEAEEQVLAPILTVLVDDLIATGQGWEAGGLLTRDLDGLLLRLETARFLLVGDEAQLGPRRAARVKSLSAALERASGEDPSGLGLHLPAFGLRGHYARRPALGRFFRAWLLLSEARDAAGPAVALLGALVGATPGAARRLVGLESLLAALVGPPAAGSGLDALAEARLALGERPDLAAVPGHARPAGAPEVGLLARRLTSEGGVLFQTADPALRPFPSALDWLAALGSARARALLEPELRRWPALADRLDQARQGLCAAGAVRSLSDRWVCALRWLVLPYPKGYASFQRSLPWADRGLVAAAASWAELRRDTLLHVQPPIHWAEGGDEDRLPPSRAGFVEPVPELFAELAGLLEAARSALCAAGGPGLAEPDWRARQASPTFKLGAAVELMRFLEAAARKQLGGEALSRAEHERLHGVGAWLERLLAGEGKLRLEPAPVAADVYYFGDPETGARSPLIAATGPVDLLWVAVPLGKRTVLARGAVSSYWEFAHPEPLSDQAWRELLFFGQPPSQPAWARPQAEALKKIRPRPPKKSR